MESENGHGSPSARVAHHLRSHVVGYIALFVALGGTALALPGKNTVDSGDIKKKGVKTSDLAPNAVKGSRLAPGAVTSASVSDGALTGTDLAANSVGGPAVDEPTLFNDDSLTGADVDESTLGQVPSAANAGQLGGVGPSGYLRWGGTIPSGVTVRGVFTAADEDDTGSTNARSSESFPLPAPADLTDAQVNFNPSTVGGDDDPACSGSFNAPTAPAGKVCVYHNGTGQCFADASATGVAIGGGGPQSRFGFGIDGPTCPAPGNASIRGTWAYTAP